MKLKEKLRDIMGSESADVVSSMDLIGDIAIIKIPDQLSGWKETIASEVLKANTNIKSVFVQKGPIHGTTRLRKIEHIKGSTDTTTLHREYGCRYLVDVQDTYFSPRLSEDRNRVSNIIKENEVVINMFAGVGPYSILIAKRNEASEVYSIELNSVAVNLHRENVKLNKTEKNVSVFEGDARRIIERDMIGVATRVLLPYPEKALDFLDIALISLRDKGYLNVYFHTDFKIQESESFMKAKKMVEEKLQKLDVDIIQIQINKVREVGPRINQIRADCFIKR